MATYSGYDDPTGQPAASLPAAKHYSHAGYHERLSVGGPLAAAFQTTPHVVDIRLDFTTKRATNSATQGIKLERNALGTPLGTTLRSPKVGGSTVFDMWDTMALDYETNDLVVFGGHWRNGEDGTREFGDQLRFAHGPFGELGRGVGLQSKLRRFAISSASGDPAEMQNLLMLQLKAGHPVLFPFRIISGELGASTDIFRVATDGQVRTTGQLTSTGGIRVEGTSLGTSTAVAVVNLHADGRAYRVMAGIEGVTNGGFSIRDTISTRTQLAITSAGSVILGPAGSLATSATDGFTHLPRMAGTPTATPTAYSGSIPIVADETGSKLWAYMGGAWKSVTFA